MECAKVVLCLRVINEFISFVNSTLVKIGLLLQPILLFLFRLNWGIQFYQTGRGKLENHEHVVQFFTELGIPFPDFNAWFVGGVECFGGLLLLFGIFSRPVAAILTINMTVAYLSVADDRAKVLNIFNNPDAFVAADPFFFLLTALLVLAFGPGCISVDSIVGWIKRRNSN